MTSYQYHGKQQMDCHEAATTVENKGEGQGERRTKRGKGKEKGEKGEKR